MKCIHCDRLLPPDSEVFRTCPYCGGSLYLKETLNNYIDRLASKTSWHGVGDPDVWLRNLRGDYST